MKAYTRNEIVSLVNTAKKAGITPGTLADEIGVSIKTATRIMNISPRLRRPRNATCYAIEQLLSKQGAAQQEQSVPFKPLASRAELLLEAAKLKRVARAYEQLAKELS